MRLGYARISTQKQETAAQREALVAAGCERIFEETASGARKDRPQLATALDYMRSGDVLLVWKLDRIARSVGQLIETVEMLEGRGMHLHSLTENIDTTSTGGKLVFHIMGALAEFERALNRERTVAGLDVARAKGRLGDRKPVLTEKHKKLAATLLDSGEYTMAEIARQVGVSRATLHNNGFRRKW